MQRRFRRDFSALEEIPAFVSEFLAAHRLGEANSFALELILEELFTNLVKYNDDGTAPVSIELDRDGDFAVVTLIDFGVKGFDITKAPEPDIDRLLCEERGGGLGIHLVRKLAGEVLYRHENGNSITRVTRRLES